MSGKEIDRLMGGEITMSSLEIAELTGKRHDNVCRDIEKMLTDVAKSSPLNFEVAGVRSAYMDAQGKQRLCYRLKKDLTLTLVSGYRADLRYRIVQRWLELENEAKQPKISTDPIDMIRLSLQAHEEARARLDAQEKRTAALEVKLDNHRPEYMQVLHWMIDMGLGTDPTVANQIGRRCRVVCKRSGIDPDKMHVGYERSSARPAKYWPTWVIRQAAIELGYYIAESENSDE